MKKTLLTLSVFGAAMMLQAQVIFNVLSPSSLEGNYAMEYVEWALTPNLINPDNSVTGELVFVNDGSTADSLGCLALTNAADVAGKIAVVYRGTCQFGVKALNANQAGAIAVVIINNVPGGPVGMAAGDVGDQVNIPVVMISQDAGAALRDEIINGNVEVFIGNKLGLFSYDLGYFAEDIYLPNGMSIPSLVAQTGAEFSYTPAVWLHNFGSEATSAARFDAVISFNGTPVYSQSVTGISLASGGSMYVSTPAFAPATWAPGLYEISLEASFDDDLATQNYVSVLEFSAFTVGSGYSSGTNVSTTTNGSGTGLTLDIVAAPIDDGGQVISYTINNPGSGYAVGDEIYVDGGDGLATMTVAVVLNEEEQFPGDNVYTMNFMISSDNIFTRSSINPDGSIIGGPGYRVQGGDAFSACVAYTHPQAGRMALSGMHFGVTGAAGTSIENELLGLTVWRMNSTFTDINDPAYSVDVTLVANADFDIPDGAENGDIFFAPVRTGDGDFLILENNQRYVFCVGTDNPDVFILFDGGGLDNRRQYEGLNGNNQPDYYIFTTGLGRFTDFYGLPAIGVEFFDKNFIGLSENNFVDVTPYPNPTTQFLNIPLNNLNGAAQLNIFDATGRMISSDNVNVQNNTLTVDVQDMATGIYTFTMSFENGKNSTFKVMINK
jgi:hypothetical protein